MTNNSIDATTGNVTQTGATTSQSATAQKSNSIDGLANEQTFLQLLVAQLKNQDPEQPQDGTQFVAQLAQFSTLEQTLQVRQDADQIVQILQTPVSTSQGSNATSNSNS